MSLICVSVRSMLISERVNGTKINNKGSHWKLFSGLDLHIMVSSIYRENSSTILMYLQFITAVVHPIRTEAHYNYENR